MTLYKWSQTASADATADSTINWAEGQSPSSVNDSARGMMAAIAKYRDDVAGAIVSSGTSTAYAVNTYQVFQSLSQLNGQVIAFTPHTTNGATVTINVDSLGAKPLRAAPSTDLPVGVLIQGTPYVALYNHADQAFYLQGLFGNPYNIPIGGSIDFWGTAAPNSSFALMYGQAISRTTYSALFALVGTIYGTGDGSTTFNIPDLRGRIAAGKDDMGGSAASRLTLAYFGTSAAALGAVGGSESKALITANLPAYTPSGTITGSVISPIGVRMRSPATTGTTDAGTVSAGVSGGTDLGSQSLLISSSSLSATFTGAAQGGSSSPVAIPQPTIISNKLLRVL
ncbi:phage tail protein [Bradyrhizobium amphicarpaeae]|uniref:Tail fiber protein n=1 Tax=Bradyrhizobium amphicarpaeae TaxID=1404768 RepID=A0A2U8PZ75_9BRAD|nr:phage tail protein [Bradyrhizobium amphicarpaeae]AWM02528.1 tail fiber protein [Bradyrhizobium amphicarpaeae]